MKICLPLPAMLGLLLCACSANPDVVIETETPVPDSVATPPTSYLSEDCTEPAYKLFRETVVMWQHSWVKAFGESEEDSPAYYVFSQANLDALRSLFPEANGVRLYYGLRDPSDSIPFLAMVNVHGCMDMGVNDPALASVLLSDANGQQFITADEACGFTTNWRTFVKNELKFHTPVSAYNYSWGDIDALMDPAHNENQLLHVRYGLRTISPGDLLFDQGDTEAYGSVVYANVMSGGIFEDTEQQFFDFAMPCPQKCDNASMLVQGCTGE